MNIELTVLISMFSVAFAVYFGLKGNKRADTKDITERVKSDTIVNVKLDEIDRNVKEIKFDLSSVKGDIKKIDERLIIVEQSSKQAHHRLDGLETRLNSGEER